MKYFTSDWHLGDPRIGIDGKPNLLYRPFNSIHRQDQTIIDNFRESNFKDGDELWHLGDVFYDEDSEFYLESLRTYYPNSTFNLIIGNYDEDKLDLLSRYFQNIYEDFYVKLEGLTKGVYLNHYPVKCVAEISKPHQPWDFAITGHIHGLWKVQRGMINVGVDAWHFKPVPETEILFCWNSMQKIYDENIFPYANR